MVLLIILSALSAAVFYWKGWRAGAICIAISIVLFFVKDNSVKNSPSKSLSSQSTPINIDWINYCNKAMNLVYTEVVKENTSIQDASKENIDSMASYHCSCLVNDITESGRSFKDPSETFLFYKTDETGKKVQNNCIKATFLSIVGPSSKKKN